MHEERLALIRSITAQRERRFCQRAGTVGETVKHGASVTKPSPGADENAEQRTRVPFTASQMPVG
jgi:hypothetical protein